jgi:hypothetical protein
LSREVQKLTPGSKVNLRVYSGGRFRDVQVTAGKASDLMRLSRFRFGMPDMDGMMEFDGPEGMMLEPQMRIMRERMEPLMKERMEPLMRERLEPLMRERWNDLPNRIQIRAPLRIRTLSQPGVRTLRSYRVDASDIEPVSPDLIRELVATTILSAQSALKQLAADGIA